MLRAHYYVFFGGLVLAQVRLTNFCSKLNSFSLRVSFAEDILRTRSPITKLAFMPGGPAVRPRKAKNGLPSRHVKPKVQTGPQEIGEAFYGICALVHSAARAYPLLLILSTTSMSRYNMACIRFSEGVHGLHREGAGLAGADKGVGLIIRRRRHSAHHISPTR